MRYAPPTVRFGHGIVRKRTPNVGEYRQPLARQNPPTHWEKNGNGSFPPFSAFGTASAKLLGMTAGWSGDHDKDKTMTLSYTNVVASIFGALIVSSMFISAAGSVPIA